MNQDERCPICEGTFERGYSTTPDLDDPACTERVKICLDCSHYTEVWAPRVCERCGFLRQRVKVTRYLQGFRDGLPGLIHIAIGCFNSFMKYSKMLERQQSDAALR